METEFSAAPDKMLDEVEVIVLLCNASMDPIVPVGKSDNPCVASIFTEDCEDDEEAKEFPSMEDPIRSSRPVPR